MRQENVVATRFNIGFSHREWEDIKKAMVICEHWPASLNRSFEDVQPRERNWWIRNAVWAIAKAVIRQGCDKHVPLACDLRDETPDELAHRLNEPLQRQLAFPSESPQDKIIELFPAA